MQKNFNFKVISLLFLIKSLYYYKLIDIRYNFILIAIVTTLFLLAAYILIEKRIAFLFLLIVISTIMIINVTYFSYFNDYISLNQLKQANMIGDVVLSVFSVIKVSYLLLFLDVIFISFLESRNSFSKRRKKMISLLVLSFLVFSLMNPLSFSTITSITNQEFFSYHLTDIYDTLTNNNSSGDKEEAIDLNEPIRLETNDHTSNEYFGIGKNRNLIVIQVESLQDMMLKRIYNSSEITPNINALIEKDSFYFKNYYQQLGKGNTSDAEFVSHNSIHASISDTTYKAYFENDYYGLPHHLKDNNYHTIAMHGYYKEFWNRSEAYPSQGFDKFISQEDYNFNESIGMGLSDASFFNQSTDFLKYLETPFYSFMITLTNHNPYLIPEEQQTIELLEDDQNTLFGNYIHTTHYTDQQIGLFIDSLKKNNLYKNSIIVIYGDHFGINSKSKEMNSNISRFLGYPYDYDEMLNIPLIIHIPNSGINRELSITGGQIDFMPTILNIMGIENKNPLTMGKDLLNVDSNLVAFQTYMLKGSFIKGDIIFEMSRDGIFEHSRAWNYRTKEELNVESYYKNYEQAFKEINLSHKILENNSLYKVVEKEDLLDNSSEVIKPSKWISHAGGRINGLTYTNCLEALNNSVEKGFKLIELDFNWTKDNQLVLIHDWGEIVNKLFGVTPGDPYYYDEYLDFKMINNWRHLTPDSLSNWLKKNPSISIVTDIKGRNIKGLSMIKENYPELIDQFIPQIYLFDEYLRVKSLGFKNIILTLYASDYTDKEILDFAKRNELYAITMPTDRAKTDIVQALNEENIFVYTHTINSLEDVNTFESLGINGFYTDDLID